LTELESLKAASSLQELAVVLGYSASNLAYILYKGPPGGRYSSFDIPKRSGGVRVIYAPDERLKALQKKLAETLEACNAEIINRRGVPDGFFARLRTRPIHHYQRLATQETSICANPRP